ncbi:MAG: CHAT domain-containing protein, partial [Acidobacteria bacterium]|nr:CHAT domain-containing protein [Acidobacteriota bacterium]
SRLLTHLARLRARTGSMDEAVPLFHRAIDEADARGDFAGAAQAWNQLGYEWLRRGDLTSAEPALIEAFRLRKLHKDKSLLLSYRLVALLRLAQGDPDSASNLIESAFACAKTSPNLTARWQLYHDRGRVRMAQGRLRDAVSDFGAAIESARTWRLEVLPADSVRISLEASLEDLYSSYVEAGNELYFRTRDRALARQTFSAAEENRAASLRALLAEPAEWHENLPAEYGQALAQLRAALSASVTGDRPSAEARIKSLEHQLTEMEARTGLQSARDAAAEGAGGHLLERLQSALARDQAYISFHTGERKSYAWAITGGQIELQPLPPRAWIGGRVSRFAAALRAGTAGSAESGRELYSALFGRFSQEVQGRAQWILGLDEPLFPLPFPALVAGFRTDGAPEFLVERHSIRIAPSAHLLVSEKIRRPTAAGGPFLGIGDAVYNLADPRWRPGSRPVRAPLEIARLAGSAREIRNCAGVWAGAAAPVVLEGPDVSREQIHRLLEARHFQIVHFALHMVPSEGKRSLIALSLQPNGEPQLLSAPEIASWRIGAGLAVLSGCSSGQGEALPGTGLMGLTRAWLAAGASAVVASRWPTPDDSGELFLSFYGYLRSLREEGGGAIPAIALQRAQQQMLHSSGWRSLPKYWAAYFTVGKERIDDGYGVQWPRGWRW